MAAFLVVVTASLVIGTVGYHETAGLAWVDSLLNAAMILTGMGQVSPLATSNAKLFASGYALFSAVVFLVGVGILVTPLFHRFLHRFHLEDDEAERHP